MVDETKLQNLNVLDFEELRPAFVDEVLSFRKKVVNNIKVKEINGQKLNGDMYSMILESYIEAINEGAVPNIENAWSYMCKQKSAELIEECYQIYVREIKESLAPLIPCTEEKFEDLV